MQFALLPVEPPGQAGLKREHRLAIGLPLRLDPRWRPTADVRAIVAAQHRHVDRCRMVEGTVAPRRREHRVFGGDMRVEQLRKRDPLAVQHCVERIHAPVHHDREAVHDLAQGVMIVMQVAGHSAVRSSPGNGRRLVWDR